MSMIHLSGDIEADGIVATVKWLDANALDRAEIAVRENSSFSGESSGCTANLLPRR
jgi:hypothetical protein